MQNLLPREVDVPTYQLGVPKIVGIFYGNVEGTLNLMASCDQFLILYSPVRAFQQSLYQSKYSSFETIMLLEVDVPN